MRIHNSLCAWALIVLHTLNLDAQQPGSRLKPVPRARLCVTEGALEELPNGRLSVAVPKMRAFVEELTVPASEVRFRYLGPTGNDAKLGSGEVRRQFGLKLRAEDACNLVYAMWRIEPESKLVVSVKANPGQHTSAECGNRGYHNIKPSQSEPVPVLRPGDSHTLRAEMHEDALRVYADNRLVWEGSVGPLDFDGPVGMRSDNARLDVEFFAGPPRRGPEPGCRTVGTETE